MPPAVRHWVYRCYDDAGVLLYVGCSAHPKTRFGYHRNARACSAKASRWLRATQARIEVEGPYPTKQEGRDAEANAIADEHPGIPIPYCVNVSGHQFGGASFSATDEEYAAWVDYTFGGDEHASAEDYEHSGSNWSRAVVNVNSLPLEFSCKRSTAELAS